jgi:hypothetical protein
MSYNTTRNAHHLHSNTFRNSSLSMENVGKLLEMDQTESSLSKAREGTFRFAVKNATVTFLHQ